jgi:hypothetical protein
MDSNQRKLTLADLQSAPFSHSGIYPYTIPACAGAEVCGGTDALTREKIDGPGKNFRGISTGFSLIVKTTPGPDHASHG